MITIQCNSSELVDLIRFLQEPTHLEKADEEKDVKKLESKKIPSGVMCI